ncbi:MAG TPA: FeoA family protein [Casimicrobiaceae bacterium]|nr:FeoA family protein [Casimicrobiaceae bacterium]
MRDDAPIHSPESRPLGDLPRGARARVAGMRPAQGEDELALTRRLREIGFVEGEPVRVVAHGYPGREPIAVRIGRATFALRRFEADRVLVVLE